MLAVITIQLVPAATTNPLIERDIPAPPKVTAVGFVEEFTNRLEVLKRRGDGMFNVGRVFERLTLDWHCDQRFGPT